jgi:hypothetical protein
LIYLSTTGALRPYDNVIVTWKTVRRVVALNAVVVALWLVVGVAGALGTWLWWLVAALPMATLVAAPFALYRISEGRTWPTWVGFVPALVLLLTALAVPGDWYMRAAGTPVAATVGAVSCVENRDGSCLYSYVLHDPAGERLPGDFRDTAEHPQGSRIDVLTDPREIFGPRPADEVDSRVFDVITLVAFLVFAAITIAAGVIGNRRRRDREPAPLI